LPNAGYGTAGKIKVDVFVFIVGQRSDDV